MGGHGRSTSAASVDRLGLGSVIENLLDAFVAVAPDGSAIYLNERARLLLPPGTEVDNVSLQQIFPSSAEPAVQASLKRVREGGPPERTVFFGKRLGKWLEVQIVPFGENIGCLFRDVTEQQNLQHALEESEQRFSRFMQHLPGLAWIKDIAGRYLYANDAALAAFGRSSDELYGRVDAEIFPPETSAEFEQNDLLATGRETGILTLETLQHADGSIHSSLVSKFPIPNPDGNPVLVGGIAIDITERKNAQDALRESEKRFRELANSLPGIVWMSPPGEGPTFLNRWYYEYSGEPEGTPGREGWAHVVHPEDRPEAFANWSRSLAEGLVWEHQLRLRRADGEYRWFLSRCVPIKDADGKVLQWLGTSVDVHDRKLIEEELERRVQERTAQLESAIAELEGFTYSVSHDLRGPVRNIVATSRMIQDDFGNTLPPGANDLLEGQVRSALRLGELIDQLLKLSRVARYDLQRTELDLTALAREVGDDVLSRGWPLPIHLEVEDGLRANGDPHLVRLVVQNLLENAAKFSPNGGRVRFGQLDGAFFVQDEGVGFDIQYVQKLFSPFERLVRDDEFPGTGIGLANVDRIIRRHGGRVWADSSVGNGATFYFTLG